MRRLLAIFAFTTLAWLDFLPSLPVVSGGLPEEGKSNGSAVEAQAYPSRMTGISEVESSRRGTASNTTTPVPSEETQTATSSKPTTVQAQSAVNRKRRDVSDEDLLSPFVTKEEAEKLASENALKIVKQLNETSTDQKRTRTLLKEAAQTIVSENGEKIMSVEVIGGRGGKQERSSGQFSTKAWSQHSADYATKQASGTATEDSSSVTVNVQYAERPKPVVEPLPTPSPNVDSDERRPEQSPPEEFFLDMGLSEDEAIDFTYGIATAVVEDLQKSQLSQEEIPSRLASWTKHILSTNSQLGFELTIRAGRGSGGLNTGPQMGTPVWEEHGYSFTTELFSGTAVDGSYTVQVYLTVLERPAPRHEVPSWDIKTELPPVLNASTANAFALETAMGMARKLDEEQASPSYMNAALGKWTNEITSQHKDSYFNLRAMCSCGKAKRVKETSSPTFKWLWNVPTTKKTADAHAQGGKYSVRVYVDYADNSD